MYRKIYEFWRREREDSNLQPLSDIFYDEVGVYLKILKEKAGDVGSTLLEKKLYGIEFGRIRIMVQNLVKWRISKIIRILTEDKGEIEASRLSRKEKGFYDHLKKCKGSLYEKIKFFSSDEFPSPELDKLDSGHILLRFLKPVPRVVGTDLKSYGPFEVEDLATLPVMNARSLIDKGIAVEVRWNSNRRG